MARRLGAALMTVHTPIAPQARRTAGDLRTQRGERTPLDSASGPRGRQQNAPLEHAFWTRASPSLARALPGRHEDRRGGLGGE